MEMYVVFVEYIDLILFFPFTGYTIQRRQGSNLTKSYHNNNDKGEKEGKQRLFQTVHIGNFPIEVVYIQQSNFNNRQQIYIYRPIQEKVADIYAPPPFDSSLPKA